MATVTFPTSRDIYLEADGKKIAVVQSYQVLATKESRNIEAFGQDQPVGTVGGQVKYIVALSRIYATDQALKDGVSFYDMDDFNLVIVKPDKKIIFTGCRWSNIKETANLGDTVLENVTLVAARRREMER